MQKLSLDQLVEITEKNQKDVAIISVLPEEKFSEAHIPGSQNIPLQDDSFVQQVAANIGDKNKKIVVYADSNENQASPKAVEKLERAGFSKVFEFEGGMAAWKSARLPFETGSLNTRH